MLSHTYGGNAMEQEKMKQCFTEKFGGEGDIRTYFAPGRVNLIGEHTDYNGGHVFPCALTIGTYLMARKRTDKKLRFYSMNFEEAGVLESSLDEFHPGEEKQWIAYPKGVMWAFGEKGYAVSNGFDILLFGNIPNGSGLSSSASVEVVTGVMLRDMYGYDEISNIDLALYGQYSENHYNGVNCGIMDQFAIAMGKKEQAIFLDTASLQYQYVPVQLKDAKIVLASSNKKRGLGDSKYNERRAQCEQALAELQKVREIPSLGALTSAEFEEIKEAVTDPVNRRRAKHAVCENERTVKAVELLKADKIEEFGELLNQSHISLRDDYEVTGIELDTLVEEAWKCEGVIGSRMTGAGFGGCTISIVKTEHIPEFIQKVGEAYKEKIGYAADFYVVDVGDGPVRL
jgi:galactokinase